VIAYLGLIIEFSVGEAVGGDVVKLDCDAVGSGVDGSITSYDRDFFVGLQVGCSDGRLVGEVVVVLEGSIDGVSVGKPIEVGDSED